MTRRLVPALATLTACLAFAGPALASDAALATFKVGGDEVHLLSTNPETIDTLSSMWSGERRPLIPMGPLRRGPGRGAHNAPWSWHFDPQETRMVEVAMEMCDSPASLVERDFGQLRSAYCPWSAQLIGLRLLN